MNRHVWLGALLVVTLFTMPDTAESSGHYKNPPSLCDVRHPSDEKIEWKCRRLRSGETLENLFGLRWKDVARYNRIDRRHARPGIQLKVPLHLGEIADFTPMPPNYPAAGDEARFILIDLSEQFLGAYEQGRLVFSAPVTSGVKDNPTPAGTFRITAFHHEHRSSLYSIEETDIPYPMTHALRFYINREGSSFWIHGRDLPGYPASHGCIGLSDEAMQKIYYGNPKKPVMMEAQALYQWVAAPLPENRRFNLLKEGPRVRIIGEAPETKRPQ